MSEKTWVKDCIVLVHTESLFGRAKNSPGSDTVCGKASTDTENTQIQTLSTAGRYK